MSIDRRDILKITNRPEPEKLETEVNSHIGIICDMDHIVSYSPYPKPFDLNSTLASILYLIKVE